MSTAPAWPSPVKPGCYRGIDFDTYARWPAANFSTLKHFRRSAAHARYEITHPTETAAKTLGQAVHVAILEPDRFDALYVAAPELDRRTVAGKAAWTDFQAAHADKLVLKADEMSECRELARAAQEHPLAGALLDAPGINEASLVWHDSETMTGCKARLDRLCTYDGFSTIVDVKTTRDASPRGFAQEVARFSYHLQAAWYLHGADQLSPVARRFVWIALEKAPPYCVGVYELDTVGLDAGRASVMDCLRRYANATDSGVWPGYPARMQTIYLPSWAADAPPEEHDL